MFYDCVVCLGDPCNEVHGMLLVMDTNRRGVRCVFVYVFVYVCVYVFVTLNGQRVGIVFRGCIWCSCQRNSLKLRIATFCSLCKHGITALVGA